MMKSVNKIYKSRDLFLSLVLVLAISFIIGEIFRISDYISLGIINSISLCLNSIIPSLFAMMLVINIMIDSNIYTKFSVIFALPSKYIFKISKEYFFIFIFGNIGGYPVGAKILTDMVKKDLISKIDAEKMMCYCFSSGPAYIIGIVSNLIFHSKKVGLVIFLSIFISNILIGFVLGIFFKTDYCCTKENKIVFSPEIMINSVEKTAKALFSVCSMIVAFSVLLQIFEQTVLIKISNSNGIIEYIKSFLEISNITQIQNSNLKQIPILTSILAFGGICVLFQVIAIIKTTFSLKLFLITRPIHLILSYLISKFLTTYVFKISSIDITTSTNYYISKNNVLPSVCLLFMVIILIIDINKKRPTTS